jgi:hypothetical protein
MKFISYNIVLLLIFIINSCSIQRNKLFKIPKGIDFTYDTLPSAPYPDYKIAVDDKISFSILANNGVASYSLICDESNNTLAVQAAGNLILDVVVGLVYPVTTLTIRVTNSATGEVLVS